MNLSRAEAERRLTIDKKKIQLHLSPGSALDRCCKGPTARHDAESAERNRWINLLADLLRNTDTSMGRLLRESPANSQLLGGTLRSRARVIQKFIAWLITAHGASFPVHWRQLVEYAQVRLSEPCVRGSLKFLHTSFLFLQEVAGIQDKFTEDALCDVTLASALPGKSPRQAPRFTTIILAALENNIISLDTLVYWRVLSWWFLLQCWATLRFDDHRAIVPADLKVCESKLFILQRTSTRRIGY